MKRFYALHYDATGYTNPTTTELFDYLEDTYAKPNKYLKSIYLDYLYENIADYYLTPTSSLVIIEADLYIPEQGTYTFQVTNTNGYSELYIDGVILTSNSLGSTGSVYIKAGIIPIRFRFVGSGGFNILYKSPTDLAFIQIPGVSLPILGYTLFPFSIYDSVSENLQHDYTIIGDIYQSRERYSPKRPNKTFQVTLTQDSVYDRLNLKTWFSSVKGKYKAFFFPSGISDFVLKEDINISSNKITVLKNFSSISHPFVQRLIYSESLGFVTGVSDVGTIVDEFGVEWEELYLTDTFPGKSAACDIQMIYFCRLDTDTLTFELYDINFSSVKLSIKELSNDYGLLRLF